jgi:hypothetical protein
MLQTSMYVFKDTVCASCFLGFQGITGQHPVSVHVEKHDAVHFGI